ncbi:hypothetical protein Y032_0189g1198 [Ancylostoma ceylanicum]|uniref:Uncharacterized protein n=1 Tax=Ancylostoma ceylanicum TaxID=53326 RepID=A0A016SRB1_9BILA|nr:hypothetical protein Y032_0189g1198 [Ancylostoma ceylanicum]
MVEKRRRDEVGSHTKLTLSFPCSAQHGFTVSTNLSHATPFQVMLAFASMRKGLLMTVHTLSESALFPRWIHTCPLRPTDSTPRVNRGSVAGRNFRVRQFTVDPGTLA